MKLTITPSIGSSMILSKAGSETISEYWRFFERHSEYKILIAAKELSGIVLKKNGNKVVGTIQRSRQSNGALVLLPDMDFDHESFTKIDKQVEVHWTSTANVFFKSLTAAVIKIDRAIKSSGDVTPEPAWAAVDAFKLQREHEVNNNLLLLNEEINRINTEILRYEEEIADLSSLRALLFEKGKPLERAIIRALRVLGYAAESYRDSNIELDVVFTSEEGRMIGEAEGKDDKPINITKLRQIALNVHEDFERDEVNVMAKGVLFGNAFRLSAPKSRAEAFTEKCLSASIIGSVALIRTQDLFFIAKYLIEKPDPEFAESCRRTIFASSGLITFPPLPDEAVR